VGANHEPVELADYPATPASRHVDPTGAGDTFLAALTVSALAGSLDLAFAAAAGSLVVEGPGLAAVPGRTAVLERMAEAARGGGEQSRNPPGCSGAAAAVLASMNTADYQCPPRFAPSSAVRNRLDDRR
jgi:hypothetical protein